MFIQVGVVYSVYRYKICVMCYIYRYIHFVQNLCYISKQPIISMLIYYYISKQICISVCAFLLYHIQQHVIYTRILRFIFCMIYACQFDALYTVFCIVCGRLPILCFFFLYPKQLEMFSNIYFDYETKYGTHTKHNLSYYIYMYHVCYVRLSVACHIKQH